MAAPLRSAPERPIELGPGAGVHPSRTAAGTALARVGLTPGPTLAHALVRRADEEPETIAYRFLDREQRLDSFTCAEMLTLAGRYAETLRDRGVEPGDCVFLCFDTGPDMVAAFYGCQLVGAVPTPIYPPAGLASMSTWQAALRGRVRRATGRWMLVDRRLRPYAVGSWSDRSGPAVLTPDDLPPSCGPVRPPNARDDGVAFVQFTSGTTAEPRGVVVRHEALYANMRAIGEAADLRPDSLCVSWLPLYHDMGLIGMTLTSFCWKIPTVLMPPLSFLYRPARWLWAMHHFRATHSGAPNFAYGLCVDKIDREQCRGLRLDAWELALNGAEPVHVRTLERFQEAFGPHGLRPTAMQPVYGMAEMTLMATAPRRPGRYRSLTIDGERLARDGFCRPPANPSSATVVVGVGGRLPGHQLAIRGPDGRALGERRQGEIWLRGPSRASGYLGDAGATETAFPGRWLRTGDLGFVVDGELYVCGRSKDLLIKAGRNYHPHDIERATSELAGVRTGNVVASTIDDDRLGTAELVVVAESYTTDRRERAELRVEVAARVVGAAGVRPDRVLLVSPGALPKTSSGKLRRGRTRELIVQGRLVDGPPSWHGRARRALRSVVAAVRSHWIESIRHRGVAAVSIGRTVDERRATHRSS